MQKEYRKTYLDNLFEVRVLELVMKDLVNKGYPPESLSTCWNEGGYIFDLAIIDNVTNELVGVIEIQSQNPILASSTDLKASVKKYAEIAKSRNIVFFIVSFPNQSLKFFSVCA